MASNFHVCYTDPTIVDLVVFNLWVKGVPQDQIVGLRLASFVSHDQPRTVTQNKDALAKLVAQDTADQLRLFTILRHYFEQPRQLPLQNVVQLAPQVQQYLVERFYSFDDPVFRELLGKKLTTKVRKDLDEVMETTQQPLESCIRQFDNLRVIFNAVDDCNFQGNIARFIAERFSLPIQLSCRYACTIFLLYSRFNIQTSRRCTQYLHQRDLELCAGHMMAHWLVRVHQAGSQTSAEHQWATLYARASRGNKAPEGLEAFHSWTSNANMDLDPSLTVKFREFKQHLFTGKRMEELLAASASQRPAKPAASAEETAEGVARLSVKLARKAVRAMLNIAAGLAQVKELRDLFEDMVADVVEPLVEARVPAEAVNQLFVDLDGWPSLPGNKFLDSSWRRLLRVLHPMTMCMLAGKNVF